MLLRQFECAACEGSTEHTLKTIPSGAAWICNSCGKETVIYTHEDIVRIASKYRVNPNKNITVIIPDNYRVYMKYDGLDVHEKLVDLRDVMTHVQLTNELPAVGRAMFAKGPTGPDGLCFAIPFGMVVRIEE